MNAGGAKKRPGWTRFAGLGFELTAAVAGFGMVGFWLGRYYGHANLGLIIGASLGIVGGLYNVIRAALRVTKEGRPNDRSFESQSGR